MGITLIIGLLIMVSLTGCGGLSPQPASHIIDGIVCVTWGVAMWRACRS